MARGEFLSLLAILTIAHTLGTISVLTLSAVSPVAAQAYGVPAYMIGYQASLIATGIIIALVFGGNLWRQSFLALGRNTGFYEQFSLTLVEAGWILTIAQVGGVCGRPFWGWLADRRGDCLTVLAILSATLVAASIGTGTLALGWPPAVIYVQFFVFGATASGWNGAYLGEVARLAPAGQVSTATGGSLFLSTSAV